MSYIVPGLVCIILLHGVWKKVDILAAFGVGVEKGLKVCLMIFPSILLMITAITVFRTSGGVELCTKLLSPLFNVLGIPPETAQIVLLRPFSGSGALAMGRDLMVTYGVDSTVGKISAIMLGASETSIYTIGLYSSFLGLKKTKHLLPCALLADLVAFLAAVWWVRIAM